MTKQELVRNVANETGDVYPFTKTGIVLGVFFDKIKNTLKQNEDVHLRPFGRFYVKNKKATKARIITTGELIELPEMNLPCFSPSLEFKQKVKNKVIKK